MNTDPIAERSREAAIEAAAEYVLANSRRGNASLNGEQYDADTTALMKAYRDIIDKAIKSGRLAALTTESRPEGLEREVVRLVVAARRVLESSDWASNIVERRERLGALDQASEAFASRVPWDDEPDANTTPHPQTNLQENLAGSQTDAPASGEGIIQAVVMWPTKLFNDPQLDARVEADRYDLVQHLRRLATPSEGARDSALEEAAKVVLQQLVDAVAAWQKGTPDIDAEYKAIDAAMTVARAYLRTAKPEQEDHVVGFADTDVEQPEQANLDDLTMTDYSWEQWSEERGAEHGD